MNKDITTFNDALVPERKIICEILAAEIQQGLPGAESKIWHGSPVWFIDGNPITGYASLKNSVQLLFWSGQSFDEPGLKAEGTFKAAEVRYTDATQIDTEDLHRWLAKSQKIQWDYKNIVKRRGVLEKLAIS